MALKIWETHLFCVNKFSKIELMRKSNSEEHDISYWTSHNIFAFIKIVLSKYTIVDILVTCIYFLFRTVIPLLRFPISKKILFY